MSLGKKMAQRRKELGLSMREVAEKVGVSQAAINNMEKRDVKSSQHLLLIAEALETSVEWLSGVSAIQPSHDIRFSEVPIIGKTSAANFTNISELEPHEIETWIMAPKEYQGLALAIRIEGDSMASPVGKSYPEGSIAVFDSGNKQPENGALVLAKVNGSDEVTFKKYISDAGKYYLMPLNPSYPRIESDFEVIAKFEYAIIN